MRNLIIIGCLALATACNSAAPQPIRNSNTNASPARNEKLQTAISHTTENQAPPSMPSTAPSDGTKSKWSQSGNPIDTKKFDEDIANAQKALKSKPNDEGAKKTLADAYFVRAMALTDARQYASALGDFRKTVKLDASNPEAKEWIDQIISIYGSLNKESPKEGEEPPPLPLKEGK